MPQNELVEGLGLDEYQYGFVDEEAHVFRTRPGLDEGIVRQISKHKEEPEWMLEFRLKALKVYESKPMPTWGGDLSDLEATLDEIYFYVKPQDQMERSWDDVPENIKNTFERLGIPEAEQKLLAGVGAQYESEMVGHGRSSYRGLCKVHEGAVNARSNVECDALLINETSRTDTYPYIEIEEKRASVGHEATVSRVGDAQLFYLMSRGLTQEEAMGLIVRGFIEPIAKELPLEYAVELNRLIELEMEGSVG